MLKAFCIGKGNNWVSSEARMIHYPHRKKEGAVVTSWKLKKCATTLGCCHYHFGCWSNILGCYFYILSCYVNYQSVNTNIQELSHIFLTTVTSGMLLQHLSLGNPAARLSVRQESKIDLLHGADRIMSCLIVPTQQVKVPTIRLQAGFSYVTRKDNTVGDNFCSRLVPVTVTRGEWSISDISPFEAMVKNRLLRQS